MEVIKSGEYTVETHKITSMADAMALAQARNTSLESADFDPDPDPYGIGQELEEALHIDLLDKDWKARPDDDLWNKRLKGRARKVAVSRLYLYGHKTDEIAKILNVSQVTVYNDLHHIEQEWRRTYLADAELIAAKDMALMDHMITKLMPAIEVGDTKAINSAIAIVEKRANVTGYREGIQVDIEEYIRGVAESNGYDPDKAVDMARRVSVTFRR